MISIILIIYNAKRYIKPVFDSILMQTYKDLEVIAVINGNSDGSKEFICQNYPQVKILDYGKNLWFAKGNNVAIAQAQGEFIQLVNQDLILAPDYVEKMREVFVDLKVGAVTGKLLRFDFALMQKTNVLDSTGIVMSPSGRAKDRGQLEVDNGQYDAQTEVFGVSGAGPMYRKSALEAIKYQQEYFDEDFEMYWEDVDLSWRLQHAGYKNLYAPQAVAYHGRTAGQSKGGYLHLWNYYRHHSQFPKLLRQRNFRNHLFMYLKNSKIIHPAFIMRELLMLVYILLLETSTLGVLPQMGRLWSRMRNKRKYIFQKNRTVV